MRNVFSSFSWLIFWFWNLNANALHGATSSPSICKDPFENCTSWFAADSAAWRSKNVNVCLRNCFEREMRLMLGWSFQTGLIRYYLFGANLKMSLSWKNMWNGLSTGTSLHPQNEQIYENVRCDGTGLGGQFQYLTITLKHVQTRLSIHTYTYIYIYV